MKIKKLISAFLCAVTVAASVGDFSTVARAAAVNTAATAETVTLGTTQTTFKYGYPDGTYKSNINETEKYFKFIPTYTGYYEFQATGYENTQYATGKTPSVSVYVKDATGKTVCFAYTNEFTLLTKKACQLTKGETYYIDLSDSLYNIQSYHDKDYGYAEQTISLSISAHSHTLVTENYSSFNYISCTECDYSTYDYNVGTVASVKLGKTSFTYNGKVQTPSIVAKDTNGKTISKSAYSVTISGNQKSVGKYTVTVSFGSNYKNYTKKLTYTIKPKSTTISKLTAGKKKFTVKWKKQATQTTGYQIQYSTNKNFKSAKTVNITKNKTVSKAISKLSAKKKYYVRVRTYKNVSGTKYYSAWSPAKTVTTKK